MRARKIVDLGIAAFERGFLDRDRLADAFLQSPPSSDISAEAFWLERGLSLEQLDMLALTPGTISSAAAQSPSPPGLSIVISDSAFHEPTPEPEFSPEERPTRFDMGNPADRFLKLGVLGVGGMGEVLQYEDVRIGRHVALKRIKSDAQNPERAAALLEREARVTGRLEHPNIVPLYDMGSDPARGPFYIMRLLSHPTLAQVLINIRRRDNDTILNYTQHKLIRCFVQVCRAVDYAHSRGVIHCDLKPANILVGPYGEVLVVDWGFCHILGERRTQRGGTPGFLAPEQLDLETGVIDARTDVFALGAVLYDILCLQHAFPILPMAFMIDAARRGEPPLPAVMPPSQRAPDRKISHELDEICLKALSFKAAGRYCSARELADAVDAYLEGTKEQERRVQRADELTAQGDSLAENFRELLSLTPERQAELNRLRASISPWSSHADKLSLWDAEDRETVLQSVSLRAFQAAIAAYEHAMDEVPNYPMARLGLARLYWEALQRAQERRSDNERIYLEGMVNQYDDGSLQRSARTVASLELSIVGPVREVSLWLTGEVGRRMTPVRKQVFSGSTIQAQGLDPGSYVAMIETSRGVIRAPLLLRSGYEVALRVDVSRVGELVPGEVLVPAGEALLGGHETSLLGYELQRVEVPAFFLEEFPVTFARYLDFLDTLSGRDDYLFERFLPRSEGGELLWERGPGGWAPARMRRWGEDLAALRSLPAVGVDLQGALAFIRWISEKTGRTYRLPTEHEWEKAARGVDGRAYPWGDHFDASFCKMRESRPHTPRPEAPGAFSEDTSPYGVRDMAGGVAEWTMPSVENESGLASNQIASRGGAWCDWRSDCHAAARRPYMTSERSERVGFRIARSADEDTAVSSSKRFR